MPGEPLDEFGGGHARLFATLVDAGKVVVSRLGSRVVSSREQARQAVAVVNGAVSKERFLARPMNDLAEPTGRLIKTVAEMDVEAPEATDEDFGWTEVLIAATVQGAIFGLVKAAIDRGGATGYRKLTGRWPDD
jgi:hypothetical protein